MQIQLSDKFTYDKLIRFTLAPIASMIFVSIYGIVDGVCVSNFAGTTAFAAVNFTMPFLMIFAAVGFMMGTGGSALVSKTLGEGEPARAREIFSQLVYALIAIGVVITILGEVFLVPVLSFFGAEGELLDLCVKYGRIALVTTTPFMVQNASQNFLVTAGRPKLGLYNTIIAGVTNIVLDIVFVGAFGWGVQGAAIATSISECIGGFVPLVYFIIPNGTELRLGKPCSSFKPLAKACSNGVSEFLTNITISAVNTVYNIQLLKYLGQDGVAAYGVLMYVSLVFFAVFIGYANGVGPIIGYKYGAQDTEQLKDIFRRSIVIIGLASVGMLLIAEILAKPLAMIFTGHDPELLILTTKALRLYAICFIFGGINVFGSALFTGLNNGIVSGVISFMRSIVFELLSVLFLPVILGVGAIWICSAVAEICAIVLTIGCIIRFKDRYHYM